MQPRDLQPEQFSGYPPEAGKLAVRYLPALRELPLSFAPLLLRELIDYDYKFPAERRALEGELSVLAALSPAAAGEWFQAFAQIQLSPKLENTDWINNPARFGEEESAWLWTTHQLDAFRSAAIAYNDRLQRAATPPPAPLPRLGVAVIGQGVSSWSAPLFRYLRPYGTWFPNVDPRNGLQHLTAALQARAAAHPAPYAHWYIDGGQASDHSPLLTCVSYAALAPLRSALLAFIQSQVRRPGMGPEELRSNLARLEPADLGLQPTDPVLDRFQVKIFTEGSGTQIFATTFAQWTAREVLRRAQPASLLVRYAPRQRQRPMNELLSNDDRAPQLDPPGSLIDADMGAWYQWIDQQRLSGSAQSAFLVWFEGQSQAVAISPNLPRGVQSDSALSLDKLLALATT